MIARAKTTVILSLLAAGLLTSVSANPVRTTIEKTGNGYQLLRDGKPYYVNGAGAVDHLERLVAAGGNSIRTWGSDQTEVLIDKAHEQGLTLTAGIWIEHERHGFDYDNPEQVEEQIARHKAAIDQFKNHPALLMWAVGNEVWIEAENKKVWDTIEEIAAYIKETDPNHPVMTVLPHVSAEEVALIQSRCPSIDLLGFNSYGGLEVVARDAWKYGWKGPFMVTEWGPDGTWEVNKTSWGAELEPTTTEKASQRLERYKLITSNPRCLGSYAFFWGQKQESTPTWFNMFLKDGSSFEGVDTMQFLWTGSYPETRAPRISPIRLNGQDATADVVLSAGEAFQATFDLLSPDSANLEIRWELLLESTDKRSGGDRERRPETIALQTACQEGTQARMMAPSAPGNYRLFVYVTTPIGKAASANFPFQIR